MYLTISMVHLEKNNQESDSSVKSFSCTRVKGMRVLNELQAVTLEMYEHSGRN